MIRIVAMSPILPCEVPGVCSALESVSHKTHKMPSLEALRLLVLRWNFEFTPSPGPSRAKAVLGYGGIGVTGIDVETLTGDKVRVVRGQKDRRADQVFGFA